MKRFATPLMIIALAAVSACGSDDDSSAPEQDAPAVDADADADTGIVVEHAWARTSPASASKGAVYFDVTAGEADTLLGVSVPSSVAADAQIHMMVAADMDEMSGDMDDMDDTHAGEMSGDMDDMDDMDDGEMSGDMDDMNDMDDMDDGEMSGDMPMVMQEMTDGLALPAGETVSLAPGGFHVMLIDLVEPLQTGAELEVTLDFATADDLTITVVVAESAP